KAVELASTEPFDILLLDLMLPGQLDGFQVCERLRGQDSTKNLPIFIISAMDDPDSRARAKAVGATDFFGKPFRPLELLKLIQNIATSRR
ncbi:MAG TPA: response regulator, partial [Polyangium sp.]|nr:response regulator [Polyangium sp.]